MNKIRRVREQIYVWKIERDSMTDDELYIYECERKWKEREKEKIHDLTYYSTKGKKNGISILTYQTASNNF